MVICQAFGLISCFSRKFVSGLFLLKYPKPKFLHFLNWCLPWLPFDLKTSRCKKFLRKYWRGRHQVWGIPDGKCYAWINLQWWLLFAESRNYWWLCWCLRQEWKGSFGLKFLFNFFWEWGDYIQCVRWYFIEGRQKYCSFCKWHYDLWRNRVKGGFFVCFFWGIVLDVVGFVWLISHGYDFGCLEVDFRYLNCSVRRFRKS